MTEKKAQLRCGGAILLLLLLCLAVIALPIVIGNFSAQWQQNQQLTTLDQQFIVSRAQIPIEVSADIVLPMQVGNFQLEDVVPTNNSKCENNSNGPLQCFAATYRTGLGDSKTWVWVSIWKKSEVIPQTLKDMLVPKNCGAELGGDRILRATIGMSYIYHICYPFLIGTTTLSGIIWENGSWFIQVGGRFEDFSQFIATFPY